MKIIDHEIKRYIVRVREFKKKSEDLEGAKGTEKFQEMAEYMHREERKLAVMVKKQEKVLFVAFHLLLNLAEDL